MTAQLSDAQLQLPTSLGDGTWSVKDLLGHLAAWESRALDVMSGRPQTLESSLSDADEFNAHHLTLRRQWSLAKVRRDYDEVRTQLVDAVNAIDDARWLEKIATRSGRSARALVIAKLLTGGRYGYLAHDFAHRRDLERAVTRLARSQPG